MPSLDLFLTAKILLELLFASCDSPRMKVHLRFDRNDQQHSHLTLFINGQNNGTLCTSPAEAIWLHHVLARGCEALRLPEDGESSGMRFVASGAGPEPSEKDMDAVARA